MKARGCLIYLVPAVGDILCIAALLSALAMGGRMMNVDGDLGRHLTLGRYMLDTLTIPTRDLFSFTMPGQPLTPHEWLSQVLFALVERSFGFDGVALLTAMVIALAFWLVYRRCLGGSRNVLVSLVFAILAIAASSLHWLTRPHIFTFLMLALWLRSLDRLRLGYWREWWQMPVIMLLWANLHGAFVTGFVTWGIFGFGMLWDVFWRRSEGGVERGFWRAFLSGGAAAIATSLINPAGLGLWVTSFGYIGSSYLVGHTAEYLPPDFHTSATWPFLLLLGLALVTFGLQSRRLRAANIFITAAWAMMGLYSVRNVPLFAIASAPFLASAWSDWLADHEARSAFLMRFQALGQRLFSTEMSLKGLVWPGIVVLLLGFAITAGRISGTPLTGSQFDPKVFPVAAVDWMQVHPPQGNGFNHFPWGGYLLYRLWPEKQVFIDGQTDFYGEKLTKEYEQVITLAPGWEKTLQKYEVRWVLIPPDGPLAQALQTSPGWKTLYQDDTAVLYAAIP